MSADNILFWERPADGARLAYTELPATKEGRRPVIVMHGWGCTHETVAVLTSAAATQGAAVFTVDFPGFGSSPEPAEPWGIDAYTRLIEDFCKAKGLERPVLIGHSFGGRVALLMGSRTPVDRLVLVDAAGIKPRHSLKWYVRVYSYKAQKRIIKTLLPKAKARALINKMAAKRGSADYRSSSPMMRSVMARVTNEDLRHVMPLIKAPSLLIWGELDTATPLSDAKTMLKLIPDAGLVTLTGADHYSFLRDPARVTAAISSFLS